MKEQMLFHCNFTVTGCDLMTSQPVQYAVWEGANQ